MSPPTAHEQMVLFEEPSAAAPPLTPAAPVPVCFETCLQEFLHEILKPGSSGNPGLLSQAFKFAELRSQPTDEVGDALTTHLLGFHESDLPRFTNNLCKTLGNIFEKLIHIVYRAAYPDLYSTDFKDLEDQVEDLRKKLKDKEKIGKWKPDFLIGVLANEIKYRCANGQGSTEQGWGARTLKKLGKHARMLFFRLSPNAKPYGRKGWECFQAAAAVALIKKETGIDIIELIRRAGEDPRVEIRRQMGFEDIIRREAYGLSFRLRTYGAQMQSIAPRAIQDAQAALSELSFGNLPDARRGDDEILRPSH